MRKIVVFPNKKVRAKDSWNWHVEEPAKKKGGGVNVLYSGHGYNSRAIAKRQAMKHNATLQRPLPIEYVKPKK